MTSPMELNDKQYQELKEAYIDAVDQNKDQFELFGQTVVTTFADQWLKTIENKRQKEGRRIYDPTIHKKTHDCHDGVKYKWTSRGDDVKVCPRCKTRLDIKKKVIP